MLYRGDFKVQFDHVPQSDVSVFKLLPLMAARMLKKSNKLQEIKEKNNKVYSAGVYRRMLWSKSHIYDCCMYVHMHVHVSVNT